VSPHESVLSPIPEQFNWMRREVRPNPLLESLLTARVGRPRLLFSLTLSEEYSDNFEQDEEDPREEFSTSLTLGTAYRVETARTFVSLANSISGRYEARAEAYDIGFANLSLNAGYNASWWSLTVSDSFVRDDDVLSSDTSGVRRERRNFLRNTVSPQVRFAFTPLTSLRFGYTNILVINDDRDVGDSITHVASTGLAHQFSRRVSSDLSYTFTTGNDEEGTDTRSHQASGVLNYIFTPSTSLSVQSSGSVIDRHDGGRDATTYGGNVELTHRFRNNWHVFAALGATLIDQAGTDLATAFTWQANLNGALFGREPLATTLAIATQQSVGDTVGDVDSVGLVQTTSASVTIAHPFSRTLRATFSGSASRTEQLEDIGTSESAEDREDLVWSAGVRLTYAFAPTWTLALDYRHSERFSDASEGDFEENRAMLALSTTFSAL
jgi:hypothetical protein